MTTGQHRETAKIYQFPLRPRSPARNYIAGFDPKDSSRFVDCGSWYHQEAIEEAKKTSSLNDPKKIS